ncbi:MAG TPA: glycosyltransferase [Ktedonobacteraceae bacterium]|nr:glycosyltransferase [Ktedonobacteraceae bacterium]
MTNILIITSRTGGGHMNLALSLKDMLSARYAIEIVDPFPAIVDRYYASLSRSFLKLWDLQYRYTDNRTASLWLHKGLTLLSLKRLSNLIEQAAPRLIISTHALLSYAVARANRQTGMHIPLAFQLTDLECVHSTWFSEKSADAYLTPTREIFAQALARGIEQNRLHVTGRPVRKQFLQTYGPASRAEKLASLQLSPEAFTVFLQGGAKGSARIERTIASIFAVGNAQTPIQIILAAGNNRAITSRFSGIANLRVLPFIETIAPYMAAADIIVGKAGASFLTEAIMLEKPSLITTYIPGQEGPNLRFLDRYNLGWTCLDTHKQQQLLTSIMQNPALIAEKVSSIQSYKTWNIAANATIAPVIENLLAYQPSLEA